jgi:hypothetical protein
MKSPKLLKDKVVYIGIYNALELRGKTSKY